VIGADDDAGGAFAADELMRAVLADVVEGADFAIPPPDRKQAFIAQIKSDVVAGIFKLTGVAGELPSSCQQTGFFVLEDLRVGVVARLERANDPSWRSTCGGVHVECTHTGRIGGHRGASARVGLNHGQMKSRNG
jgi:hypothetical protein